MRLLFAGCLLLALTAKGLADPMVGDRWAEFKMRDTTGRVVKWTPGRVTVISFCAYWCDTWKQQVPRLAAARGATSGLPVDFRTVSIDGRWAEVANRNQGLPLWLDAGGEVSHGRGVDRVPTTVVMDASGELRFVRGGVVRTEDIVKAVHECSAPRHSDTGVLYLTFDDFPSPIGSEELLDVLRSLGVKATFFCMGSRIESSAKLLKRALAEGHSLQCHSWDHNAASPGLDRCQEAFERVLGIKPTLYRAPGSERIIGEDRHHAVVDPYDFARPAKRELLRRVLSAASDEAVIQLHSGVSATVEALPDIIENLRKRGFRFGVLGSDSRP